MWPIPHKVSFSSFKESISFCCSLLLHGLHQGYSEFRIAQPVEVVFVLGFVHPAEVVTKRLSSLLILFSIFRYLRGKSLKLKNF